jgi:hypothetical protein
MKAPAFFASALGALGAAGGKLRSVFSGAAGAARRAAGSIAVGAGRVASGMDRKTLRYVGIGAAALSGLAVIAVIVGAIIAGAGAARDRKVAEAAATPAAARSAGAHASAVPKSGPGLASMLLIPGEDEWPWPLALEPKERYTEADAAAVRPDMSEVDVSDLTRRRKAELEAIYGAVD